MPLDKCFKRLAGRVQEALQLSHGDVRKTLSDALKTDFPDTYAGVEDVFGDQESGDVVYSSGYSGGTYRAPYAIGTANGKRAASIDHEKKTQVYPRVVYDEKADAADGVTSMGEAERELASKLSPGQCRMILTERFVSKSERDAADKGDFAGKNKSFPILKKSDVAAAVSSLGRAGSDNYSVAVLKANIIKIAKRKGWTSELPSSWQAGAGKESELPEPALPTDTVLKESTFIGDLTPIKEGAVGQDGSVLLKLISPGWGSTGYYSKEMLARDVAKAFPAGTKNFWDHPTAEEEAARPEGSLRNLASVTTEAARFMEQGPDGPGAYAKAKVFDAFKQPVEDLAKHIGMSIRAAGKAREGTAEGRKGPIIEELSRGFSVDYVTSAGRGGRVLQLFEAARDGSQIPFKESAHEMDETQIKSLIDQSIKEAQAPLLLENRRLRDQVALLHGPSMVREALKDVKLPDASKDRIVKRLGDQCPLTEAGAIDATKLKAMVEAEAKEETTFLEALGVGKVIGFGSTTTPAAQKDEDPAKLAKESEEIFAELMGSKEAGKFAAEGQRRRIA